MKSIESKVKTQFAKVFNSSDWRTFKLIAEYYFRRSATLKTKDIDINVQYKLLMRNIQKRLFLGIATELLLKCCYLKNGFIINKPLDSEKHKGILIRYKDINKSELNPNNTFTLNELIGNIKKILLFSNWSSIEQGLKILKVFRNKEGHIAVLSHQYEPTNYRDIENAITKIYKDAFKQDLIFKISMEATEKGQFTLTE